MNDIPALWSQDWWLMHAAIQENLVFLYKSEGDEIGASNAKREAERCLEQALSSPN